MIVWKGWGLAVIVIAFLFVLPIQFSVEYFYGEGQYQALAWPVPLVFLLSAIPTTLLGVKLNNRPARILIDPETGEKVELKTTHSLFWIPMHYWGVVQLILAVLIYLR